MTDDFTIMSHETHGQCWCAHDFHCGGGVDCQGCDYDDLDTLGGRLRTIETETKRLGAHGLIAGIDQIRARNRDATEAAIRDMFGDPL